MPKKRTGFTAEEEKLLAEGKKLLDAKVRAWLKAHPDKRALIEADFHFLNGKRRALGNPEDTDLETFVHNRAMGMVTMEMIRMRSGPVTKKMVTKALGREAPPGWDDLLA